MTTSLLLLAGGLLTVALYSLLLLAVCAGRAYRNGYEAALRDAAARRGPQAYLGTVTALPQQRTVNR